MFKIPKLKEGGGVAITYFSCLPQWLFNCLKSILFSFSNLICSVEITQAEAYDILQKCVLEIQKRLIINLTNFKVAVVDKNGQRRLDDITAKTLQNYVA